MYGNDDDDHSACYDGIRGAAGWFAPEGSAEPPIIESLWFVPEGWPDFTGTWVEPDELDTDTDVAGDEGGTVETRQVSGVR